MDAISSIGSMVSGGVNTLGSTTMPIWQKLLGLGTAGAGGIGNILAGNKRNQVLNQQLTNQQQLMNLVNNPTQLATNAAALQRPLSAGLTSSVGNAVQGYLAERGLSQSPGIASETLAQGLAPYQLQEQQMAMQSYLQSLGLPAQASARFLPYPQSTDLSKLFQSLLNPNAGSGGNLPFGTVTPGSPAGIGVANQPTMDMLMNQPDTSTGDTGGTNFNWMDLLSNGSGLIPSEAS